MSEEIIEEDLDLKHVNDSQFKSVEDISHEKLEIINEEEEMKYDTDNLLNRDTVDSDDHESGRNNREDDPIDKDYSYFSNSLYGSQYFKRAIPLRIEYNEKLNWISEKISYVYGWITEQILYVYDYVYVNIFTKSYYERVPQQEQELY
jgi:hypothetical protein